MLRLWEYSLIMLIHVLNVQGIVHKPPSRPLFDPTDWQHVENLAELYPYVVALLNSHKEVSCTGAIISENTVLTTGVCASAGPVYVAIGIAVIRLEALNEHNVFNVTDTLLPTNYIFDLNRLRPNATIIENNIGLVITEKKSLDTIFDRADVSDFYASELSNKIFVSVGYTRIDDLRVTVLSQLWYHEAMCENLKWYYCMCGYEFSSSKHNPSYKLGEGGPAIYEGNLVAVNVFPSGLMETPKSSIKYNVFTIVAPYKRWLLTHQETIPLVSAQKKAPDTNVTSTEAPKRLTADSTRNVIPFLYVLVLLVAIKVVV